MKVKVWGTRGSMPVSGPDFNRYGGATTCLEVITDAGETILLDAGTGIHDWARHPGSAEKRPVVCLSHLHMDHIQGLPFYSGIYRNPLLIYGPPELEKELPALFNGKILPMTWASLPKHDLKPVKAGESFSIGSALIETAPTNHPGGGIAYKISADGWTFAYSGDHEIPLDSSDNDKNITNARLMDFLADADVALVDSHFSREDHEKHPGWGHSHIEQWITARQGNGYLIFSHYGPEYTDGMIDSLVAAGRKLRPDIKMRGAHAGCMIGKNGIEDVPDQKDEPGEERPEINGTEKECGICAFLRRIADFTDTHSVLDALLTEARRLANADAGTIYLVDNNELMFAAAQNDTLFPKSAANKFSYMNSRLPMDKNSIAGYVAVTGRILNIPDVYDLPEDSTYGFNASFDQKAGYRTGSMLVIPFVNNKGKIVGVLQLINSKKNGIVVPFHADMQKKIANLCVMATIPLERALLVTDMILRMLRTSALRDPKETAGHVRRVGSMAAELYHAWAEARNIEPEELLAAKGQLRLAAMLHDVGKVGIPDAVLKKPGRLDDAERAVMQEHACLGADLFEGANEIDVMAREIALHHHAKWDGSGYTGTEAIPSPAGEDIPLWARITAIADVYDALVSRRCYKDSWDPSQALEILQKDAGSHFDPELVKHFLDIQDTIKSIFQRFGEKQE